MKKFLSFEKVVLTLLAITMLISTIELNQIRIHTQMDKKETLWVKVCNLIPRKLELNNQVVCRNKACVIVKDKQFSDELKAPYSKYDYFEGYTYRRYIAQSDRNKLFYIDVNIRSLFNKVENIDELISAKVVYDKKYEFECFAAKLTNSQTDFTKNIELVPLQNEDVYFVAELPKDFINDTNPLYLELTIGDKKYKMNLR